MISSVKCKLLNFFALLIIVVTILSAVPAFSQQDGFGVGPLQSNASQREELVEVIAHEKKSLSQAAELTEEEKAEQSAYLNQAERELARAKLLDSEVEKYRQLVTNAPLELEKLRARLKDKRSFAGVVGQEQFAALNIAELENRMRSLESNLEISKQLVFRLSLEFSRRASRLSELNALDNRLRGKLSELTMSTSSVPSTSSTASGKQLQLIQKRAELFAVESELRAHHSEREYYFSTDELIPLSRDVSMELRNSIESEIVVVKQALKEHRAAELQRFLAAFEQTSFKSHPVFKVFAAGTVELAEEAEWLSKQIEESRTELEKVSSQLQATQSAFVKVREEIEVVKLSQGRGEQLRRSRTELPKSTNLKKNISRRDAMISDIEAKRYRWQDERAALIDLKQSAGELLGETKQPLSNQNQDELTRNLERQLKIRKKFIDSLLRDYRTLLELLITLSDKEHDLGKELKEYRDFIDQQVLWLRSTTGLSSTDVYRSYDAFVWILDWANWHDVTLGIITDIQNQWYIWIVAVLLIGAALKNQKRARKYIEHLGEKAARPGQSDMAPTVTTVLATIFIVVSWPLALSFLGWRLSDPVTASAFSRAVSHGLYSIAIFLGLLGLVLQICRPKGLGEMHFSWQVPTLKSVRKVVYIWCAAGGVPYFIGALLDFHSEELWTNSLGRLCFLSVCLILAYCGNRLLHPSKGILALGKGELEQPQTWVKRLRILWYLLLLATIIGLFALATSGYYSTARVLLRRLILTMYLAVMLVSIRAFIARWIVIKRRQLLLRQMQILRDERLAKGEDESESSFAVIDFQDVSGQAATLLGALVTIIWFLGIYSIWETVIPALTYLSAATIWPSASSLTVADLFQAVLILVVSITATKNFSGLLELLFFRHLPLDAGARYATVTIGKYCILLLGVGAFCTTLGITWSSVQWLLAAVSLGLGFGLQEIVANFISGIILLFERPMRIGDLVTMGDVSGNVRKISMRATTILDWDRREHIIPNKDFITTKLVNWTLSDTVSRATINVGIAYGSDTEQAREILLQVARNNPTVLEDPPPYAVFDGFGDSALLFILRVFLPNREVYMQLRHELHTEIDKAFRLAGIEISFPQQDIHIRSGLPGFENMAQVKSNDSTK